MSAEFKRTVFNKFEGRCAYCGNQITIDNMTVDHKVPRSKGGSVCLKNCLPSCKRCNELKADGTIGEMRSKIENLNKTIKKNKEYQMLKKYGLISILDEPVLFLYEKEIVCE